MKVKDLGFDIVVEGDLEREVDGIYICDLLSLVMAKANKDNVWITVQTNVNIVAVAVLVELACIVVSEGMEIDELTAAKAKEQGVTILRSKEDSFSAAKRI